MRSSILCFFLLQGCAPESAEYGPVGHTRIALPDDTGGDWNESAQIFVGPTELGEADFVSTASLADLDPFLMPEFFIVEGGLVPGGIATIRYRGDLAGEDKLTMVFGWDGWTFISGMTGPDWSMDKDEDGTIEWRRSVPMVPVDGGFEATVNVPEGVSALNVVFASDDLLTMDDRDGQEFHWSVEDIYVGPMLTWTDS